MPGLCCSHMVKIGKIQTPTIWAMWFCHTVVMHQNGKQCCPDLSMVKLRVITVYGSVGATFISVEGLNKVAKKLDIDCAPAMVGWDHHCGFSHPRYSKNLNNHIVRCRWNGKQCRPWWGCLILILVYMVCLDMSVGKLTIITVDPITGMYSCLISFDKNMDIIASIVNKWKKSLHC